MVKHYKRPKHKMLDKEDKELMSKKELIEEDKDFKKKEGFLKKLFNFKKRKRKLP